MVKSPGVIEEKKRGGSEQASGRKKGRLLCWSKWVSTTIRKKRDALVGRREGQ